MFTTDVTANSNNSFIDYLSANMCYVGPWEQTVAFVPAAPGKSLALGSNITHVYLKLSQ